MRFAGGGFTLFVGHQIFSRLPRRCRWYPGGERLGDFHPVYQAIYIAAEQGVQYQHRQREIVHIIIVIGDFELNGVMLVDFGQYGYVVRIQNIGTLFQRFPNFRLNKEAVGADFFVGIGKSIQADDGGALFAQKFRGCL